MKEYSVSINVMPRAEISDPQGQAVQRALPGLGFHSITSVRVGKRITLEVQAEDPESAADIVERACKVILANPVIEDFSFEVSEGIASAAAVRAAGA